MYGAKEARTGRIVAASEASLSARYVCPVCKVEVFLRRGRRRADHFAHWPGLGSPDCERYFAGGDIHHPFPTGSTSGEGREGPEIIPPMALSLALQPKAELRGRRLQGWRLALTVPRSPDSRGHVSVDCGGGIVREIALAKLVLGPQTYLADPDGAEFSAVRVSPEVRPAYRSAIAQRIPGLVPGQVTVFESCAHKHKPRVASISWGASYYFVWRRDNGQRLPEDLPGHRLADNGAWCCSLVSLPNEGEESLANWLEAACGLRIVKEKRTWGIIYPVAFDVDVSGRIRLPPTPSVLVGLSGPAEPNGESACECAAGEFRASIITRNGGLHFIEITADKTAADSVLSLRWGQNSLPALARVPLVDVAHPPAVVIEFLAKDAKLPWRERMHEASCRELLRKARASEINICKIELPASVAGHLWWRAYPETQWQSLPLEIAPGGGRRQGTVLSPGQLSELNRILQDLRLDVWLDFGAFGEFLELGEKPPLAGLPSLHLQPSVRAKIVWLCKTMKAYTTTSKMPIDELDDDELVAHFRGIRVDASLLAHCRSIERTLASGAASRGVQ
jgi:hypothetical protein